jgi:hypothetical protein
MCVQQICGSGPPYKGFLLLHPLECTPAPRMPQKCVCCMHVVLADPAMVSFYTLAPPLERTPAPRMPQECECCMWFWPTLQRSPTTLLYRFLEHVSCRYFITEAGAGCAVRRQRGLSVHLSVHDHDGPQVLELQGEIRCPGSAGGNASMGLHKCT